jgi:ABC-type glycerol-3-phosphate transport system permease component
VVDRRTTATGRLRWLAFALVLAAGVALLTPILWMLSTSLKPLDRVFELPVEWLPAPPRWATYRAAWRRFDFDRYFLNSLVVSAAVTLLNVLLAGFAGYGLAKFRFIGRRVLFVAILGTLMLPIEVLMVPTFLIVKDLGWLNTYQGLVVPMAADAFGVFLMRQFLRRLPDSLLEAARIDGAGEIRIYFRIVVPLSWPAILTLALFTWRETWDAFVWPFLIVTDDRLRTIPLGVQRFQEAYVSTYNEVMAISALAMVPLALLFLLFQRAFLRGIALSGLKD